MCSCVFYDVWVCGGAQQWTQIFEGSVRFDSSAKKHRKRLLLIRRVVRFRFICFWGGFGFSLSQFSQNFLSLQMYMCVKRLELSMCGIAMHLLRSGSTRDADGRRRDVYKPVIHWHCFTACAIRMGYYSGARFDTRHNFLSTIVRSLLLLW